MLLYKKLLLMTFSTTYVQSLHSFQKNMDTCTEYVQNKFKLLHNSKLALAPPLFQVLN